MSEHGFQAAPSTGRHLNRLVGALVLTGAFLIVETIGGLWTGSLALLADAGHMLTDVGGLVLALLAVWFARRPPTAANTYGYFRMEILAALANGGVLFGIAGVILYEAYRRIWAPPEVLGGPMLAIAVVGLGVNLAGMWLLGGGAHESLWFRSRRRPPGPPPRAWTRAPTERTGRDDGDTASGTGWRRLRGWDSASVPAWRLVCELGGSTALALALLARRARQRAVLPCELLPPVPADVKPGEARELPVTFRVSHRAARCVAKPARPGHPPGCELAAGQAAGVRDQDRPVERARRPRCGPPHGDAGRP